MFKEEALKNPRIVPKISTSHSIKPRFELALWSVSMEQDFNDLCLLLDECTQIHSSLTATAGASRPFTARHNPLIVAGRFLT